MIMNWSPDATLINDDEFGVAVDDEWIFHFSLTHSML
jgi:hypothetical protein